MPPIAPADHLTSFLFVQASSFAKNENNTAIRSVLSVIGDRFARWLPPNFCVQHSVDVDQNELLLFLSAEMRNSIPMAFVFKMKLVLFAERGQADDYAVKQRMMLLFSAMRNALMYITQLDVQLPDRLLNKADTLRHAFFASSLPPSLQHVTISTPSKVGLVPVNAADIRALAAIPHLRELRLRGALSLTQDGVAELFRAAENSNSSNDSSAKQQQQQQQPIPFFPSLRCIEATTEKNSHYVDLLTLASRSIVLPQLREINLQTPAVRVGGVDVSAVLKPLLEKSFSHVRVWGHSVLAGLSFQGGPVDLSPLRGCVKIGDSFLQCADCNGETLDLSVLRDLKEIGEFFLRNTRNIGALVLPGAASVASIAAGFCASAQLTAIELRPISASLQSIDVSCFARNTPIVELDTTPLAGKIVGSVDCFFVVVRAPRHAQSIRLSRSPIENARFILLVRLRGSQDCARYGGVSRCGIRRIPFHVWHELFGRLRFRADDLAAPL